MKLNEPFFDRKRDLREILKKKFFEVGQLQKKKSL